jgi:hypothetical protein
MAQVELVFLSDPQRYSADGAKIATIGSLLEGAALDWFSPFLDGVRVDVETLNDYVSFKAQFSAAFGDADRAVVARHKLTNLRQVGPAIHYVTEFRRIAADLDWNDTALIDMFHLGLKPRIQELLLTHSKPASLEDFYALAIRLDNHLYQFQQGVRLGTNQRQPPNTAPAAPRLAPAPQAPVHHPVQAVNRPVPRNGPQPMELGNVRRGISEEERQHRRDNGLCL